MAASTTVVAAIMAAAITVVIMVVIMVVIIAIRTLIHTRTSFTRTCGTPSASLSPRWR